MILAIVTVGVFMIGKWGEPLPLKANSRLWILAGAAAELGGIMVAARDSPLCEKLLWGCIGGSLLLACVADSLICQVYNFTWWIFLAAALALFWRRQSALMERESGMMCIEMWGWLFTYVGVQLLLAGRIYGRADSYAFCACALAETAWGISVRGYLTHMLLAYLLLFTVQLFRHNLNRRGNLRRPVPFLPYITAAFWVTLAMYSAEWQPLDLLCHRR